MPTFDHPSLRRLFLRRPYANHWGQRLLGFSSPRGLTASLCDMGATGIAAGGAVCLLQCVALYRAEATLWQLLPALLLAYFSFQTLRVIGLMSCSGLLTEKQAELIKIAIAEHSQIVEAAAHWMVEGEILRQRDWRLIRKAELSFRQGNASRLNPHAMLLQKDATAVAVRMNQAMETFSAGGSVAGITLPAQMNPRETQWAHKALKRLSQSGSIFKRTPLPLSRATIVQLLRGSVVMEGWTGAGSVWERGAALLLGMAAGAFFGALAAGLFLLAQPSLGMARMGVGFLIWTAAITALMTMASLAACLWQAWTRAPVTEYGRSSSYGLHKALTETAILAVLNQLRQPGDWLTPRQCSRLLAAAAPFMAFEARRRAEMASEDVVKSIGTHAKQQSSSLKEAYDLDRATPHAHSTSSSSTRRL